MKNIPSELLNEVCHTTTVHSFISIYESGFIFTNPDPLMLNHEKYGNIKDKNNQTYVQSIGGISLFDFVNFSIKEYEDHYKPGYGDLYRFLPFNERNNKNGWAVWLVIDTDKFSTYFNRDKLMKKWEGNEPLNMQFIPKVEATILENISVSCIKKVYLFNNKKNKFYLFSLKDAYDFITLQNIKV